VIVDRLTIRKGLRGRIADAVEAALDLGRGVVHVLHVDSAPDEKNWTFDRYSQHFACDQCGRSFEELTPNHFSFNAALGWCTSCEGLGVQAGGGGAILSDVEGMTLRRGAVDAWPRLWGADNLFAEAVTAVVRNAGFSIDDPFQSLKPEHQRAVLYGTGDEWIDVGRNMKVQYKGVFPAITEASRVSWVYRHRLADIVGQAACTTCNGSRLRDAAAAVQFHGKTLHQWCSLPLGECLAEFKKVKATKDQRKIAGELMREITHRLQFLVDVGLDYLTLARGTPTLSGGEAQRIRLASQLGSGLTGVLYLLDEPTIGLHPRDNGRLLGAIEKLRDLGNTLILVEHDREVIEAADYLIDVGPGAGRFGGAITAAGSPAKVRSKKAS
ncbi:MAG: excinuclease ABC subunit UvrA, partial [Planctomycetia bacterium]